MNEPIDHHYLPVFYLRQWCNAEGRVVRYYRPHRDVVAQLIAPHNTGYEPHLYSLLGHPPGKEQVIETDFMARVVDEPAAMALKILIQRDKSKMTEEMRIAWTRFLMAMNLRNPQSLADIGATAHDVVKSNLLSNPEAYLATKSDDDPPNAYEWMEKNAPHVLSNIGKLFLPGLIDSRKVGDHIINMHWSTFDLSESSVTLLTCDRPFITTHGLVNPRCVLAFPIAPRFLFVATNTVERRREILAFTVSRIAKAANATIVGQAVRCVYGDTARHVRFVENRLRR